METISDWSYWKYCWSTHWRLRLDDNGDDGEITVDEESVDNDSDDEDDLRQAQYDDNH